MKSISAQHDEAMAFAEKAVAAQRQGNHSEAIVLFSLAFERERDAALRVNEQREPTRSILLRSAASLAVDCGRYREAEKLIAIGLAGNPPEEIAEELRDLYENVTFDRHLEIKGTTLSEAEIQLSLSGSAVGYGIVPSEEYLPRVQTVESLLIRTAERQRSLPFREKGRVPKAISDDFKIYFSVALAASFAVTIRLGRATRQKQLFHDEKEVVDEFVTCLKLYNEQRRGELEDRIASPPYYRNFVHQVGKITPDGERIHTVGVTIADGDQLTKVALTPSVPETWEAKPSKRYKTVKLQGILTQAAKSDRRNVIGIKEDSGKLTQVQVPVGLMNEIVRPLWDRRVAVTAKVRNDVRTLANIVPLDDDESEENNERLEESAES